MARTATLLEALDAETAKLLVDSKIQNPELVNIRLIKARSNLEKAIELYGSDALLEIQDRLLSIEYNASQEPARITESTGTNEASENKNDSVSPLLVDELNMLPSEMKVRRRDIDKLDVNSHQQGELSEELVNMAKTIKKNAELFQQKLDTDSDLVSVTTDALTRTAGTMSNVGQRLSKYRKETQLGWMFYIWSVLFIVFSLLIGMALIQLFGKW